MKQAEFERGSAPLPNKRNRVLEGIESMVTYHQVSLQPFKMTVKLDGKKVGAIHRPAADSYFYKPVGGLPGETFDTLEGVQESLA